MAELILYTESEEFKAPLMRNLKDVCELSGHSPIIKRFKSEAKFNTAKSPKHTDINSSRVCHHFNNSKFSIDKYYCDKNPKSLAEFKNQRKKRGNARSILCSEEAVTFENNENCSNNQKDNKKEIKSSNYGTKGLKLTKVKSKGKASAAINRSTFIGDFCKASTPQFANESNTYNSKTNLNGLKSFSKNSIINTKVKEKYYQKKSVKRRKPMESKRLTIESVTIRNNSKDKISSKIESSRNTRRFSDKTNIFVNSAFNPNKMKDISIDKEEIECANYLKRTVSSNLKDKSQSQSKIEHLRSNLSPSNSESVVLKNLHLNKKMHKDKRLQMIRSDKLSNCNTAGSDEKNKLKIKEDMTIIDLYNQSYPIESNIKFEYFNKPSYANKRLVTVSRERTHYADRNTDCTSANKKRDYSKNSKNPKEIRLYTDDSEVRLYKETDYDNNSQNIFIENCEDAKFKAKLVPKSHRLPHMIFHSTKNLTEPKEPKFNINRKDKIEETEGEGEIKEDDDEQILSLNNSIQKIPQSINPASKKAISYINEGIGKTRAFNYINNKEQTLNELENNSYPKEFTEENRDSEAREEIEYNFNMKDLITKARIHAKKSKPIKPKEK